jgi:hypothetical protein
MDEEDEVLCENCEIGIGIYECSFCDALICESCYCKEANNYFCKSCFWNSFNEK